MLTEQQLAARKVGIGGSDAPCLLGYGFKTPMQIYLDKTGQNTGEKQVSNAMYYGTRLESFVAEEYEFRTGNSVAVESALLIHPRHKFMIGNIDRRIKNQNKILECKTTAYKSEEWGETGSDEIPKAYLIQCAHYAAICDVEAVDIAVFFLANRELGIYTYRRSEKLENKLIEVEKEFWENHVLPKIPPAASTLQEIRQQWSKANNEATKIATPEMLAKVAQLKALIGNIRAFEAEIEKLQFDICSTLEDAAILLEPNGEIVATWKNQESQRLDSSKLKLEQPLLYQQYSSKSETRVLRIK